MKDIKRLLKKSSNQLHKVETVEDLLESIKKKPFPECFYRGFTSKECFTPFGYLAAGAFSFKPNNENPRNDSFNEASINWDDDEGALKTLLSQINKRTGEPQFKFGYVKMPLSAILPNVRSHIQNGHFSYERAPLEDNHYHGNLLLHSEFKGQESRAFQDGLAMIANAYYKKEESPILEENNHRILCVKID